MTQALKDIKVLDFSRIFAGPLSTMILRELGAQVIKIEMPGEGDPLRQSVPLTQGSESNMFLSLNRGKKSITLNLKSERGAQIARDLAKKADVLVENFSYGVMDKLGLGYDELRKTNPRLVYASCSGFGQRGPHCSEPAFDTIIQARGGFINVTGFPDGPPIKAGPPIADFISGLCTVISALAALHHREKTGRGQRIDISMQDCMWLLVALPFAPFYFLENRTSLKFGNADPDTAPFNIYQTKDGYVVITVLTAHQWENLLLVIGREDLVTVEKYSTNTKRVRRRAEIDSFIEQWTKARTANEIVSQLKSARVPCAYVPTFDQVANDPQLLSREMVVEIDQPVSGKVKVPGSVFKMSDTPGDPTPPAPFLGEHNYEIYSRLLGYSKEEIVRLQNQGII